ncbi:MULTISPECIES: spermidine synthase [Corallococcus]|uniref:spermidine synthase n=1 Tax=Corallococcus TaxID=83461 RepID=UPI001F35B63B|nr:MULTISPECIES: fused MFS/spermidine synthase [Corallococcus]
MVWPGEPLRLELPYTRMSMVALAFVPRPENILAIGLGGGAIPMFLRAVLPDTHIDVVELDAAVVDAAKMYCGFQEDALLRTHVADGRAFIEEDGPPYDLIFLDAYGAEQIPGHLATREFLGAVRSRLSRGGAVVSNVWESAANPHFDAMVRTYQVSFHGLSVFEVPTSTNRILVGLEGPLRLTREALVERARQVERERKLPFRLSPLVSRRYRPLTRRLGRGRVLTDAMLGPGGLIPEE